jgi:hypothetical protein
MQLNYNDYSEKVGSRYNIVEGLLVESSDGVLTVSTEFKQNTIYVDTYNKCVNLIVPEKAYIGRHYFLKKSDCIKLVNEWLDDRLGTDYVQRYKNTSNADFKKYYSQGVKYAYLDNDFKEVDHSALTIGDVIIYINYNHVAVLVDTNKVLHHLPKKLSCYDVLDTTKILGVYRP